MKSDKDTWLKEYTEFIQSDRAHVPSNVFINIKQKLFPNPWIVLGKIFGIHSIVGFLSLAICNQFGLNPFGTDRSLMDWFMNIGGHNFCMVACGVFFMMTTYLLANVILKLEELETIRFHKWLQTGLLGLVSLAAFYFFGAEMVVTFAALWILGAFIGGLVAIEGSYFLRKQMQMTI